MKYLLCGVLLMVTGQASAQVPSLLANCTRSANLLACVDAQGNAYSVATVGSTTYLRGFEVIGKRYWAQTARWQTSRHLRTTHRQRRQTP